ETNGSLFKNPSCDVPANAAADAAVVRNWRRLDEMDIMILPSNEPFDLSLARNVRLRRDKLNNRPVRQSWGTAASANVPQFFGKLLILKGSAKCSLSAQPNARLRIAANWLLRGRA